MKTKVTFKSVRILAAGPVRVINNQARAIAKPAARLKNVIWRGLKIHAGTPESFREMLNRRATAPFHFDIPGLKAGKA